MSAVSINHTILQVSNRIDELILTSEELYGAIFTRLPQIEEEIELALEKIHDSEGDELAVQSKTKLQLAIEPVQDLMVKIQMQDIMRQGLENIQKCLLQIKDNISEIDNSMVNKLDEDCSEVLMNTLVVNKSLLKLIIDLNANIKNMLVKSLIDFTNPLNSMKRQLEDTIGKLSWVLLEEIEFVSGKLASGANLILVIDDISTMIQLVYRQIDGKLSHCIGVTGHNSWDNSNTYLQEVLNYFTTYSERVIAQLHMDNEQIDVGTDGGDLILF